MTPTRSVVSTRSCPSVSRRGALGRLLRRGVGTGLLVTSISAPGSTLAASDVLDANKHTVRSLYKELYGKDNLDIVDTLFSPDYAEHQRDAPSDREQVKQGVASLRTIFPDMLVKVDDIAADGTKVWVRSTFTGTHVQPTEKPVEWTWFDVYQLADGLIVAHWGIGEYLKLYLDLGYTLTPPAQ